MITIEFFGVPRLRAGMARLTVDATTLAEALDGLLRRCPELAGVVGPSGRVHPAYRLALNGERFISAPETPLADGDSVLLLAADMGG